MALTGLCDPGLESVRDRLESSLATGMDTGVGVAVYHQGRIVFDMWGGEARPGVPWDEHTMATVFSTTKGPTTLTIQVLTDRGQLDIDRPVADYWPEFAAAGKQDITLADVMSHRSGVITFPDYHEILELEDHWGATEVITERLAAAEPLWKPGTQHGYHALTFGWILGEVVRRVTGTTLGAAFRALVAEPLGLDFWIGLPAEHHDRVANLIDASPPEDPILAAYLTLFNPDTWTGRAHFVGDHGIGSVADSFNTPGFRSVEIPAGGGIGSARGLARMYAALAAGGSLDGVDLVSQESIDRFTAERSAGPDAVLLFETRYGIGYARPTEINWYGPNDPSFGHGGLGGSVGFADPVAEIGFAYVPNQLRFHGRDDLSRSRLLVDALYGAL